LKGAIVKTVIRRPWLHHLIIICYIAAPFANVLLVMAFLRVPFSVVFRNLVAGYGPLASVWLLTAPIVGVSLYFVRRFSWYVFLGHSSLILLDFIIKWATRPAYYLRTVPGFHNVLLLTGNLALVGVVAYIIQRDFRSPYFQVLNRSWRERKRVPIWHVVQIDGQTLTMNDLSASGCFVLEAPSHRRPGDKVEVSFQSNALKIDCRGEVMRVTATGIGVRFMNLPRAKRRDILALLRSRFNLRQKVDIPCTWIFHEDESQSRMVDLSSGGCYLQAQLAGLSEGASGQLNVVLNNHSYSLPGEIVWINRMGQHQKPAGFGFRFSRSQAGFMKEATRRYGQGILVR
jgi:hypothetical protein